MSCQLRKFLRKWEKMAQQKHSPSDYVNKSLDNEEESTCKRAIVSKSTENHKRRTAQL
jgi:hypothetical protein